MIFCAFSFFHQHDIIYPALKQKFEITPAQHYRLVDNLMAKFRESSGIFQRLETAN